MSFASPSKALRDPTRDEPVEKTGYRLRKSVADGVRNAVEQGEAKSQNEFVERAIAKELDAVRRKRLYEAYAEAARDPAFRQDMEAASATADNTVADGLVD